ncbi:lipocalin family protein [Pseudorhodoferax sp.]|uniref:lipocalin family protein n=1 Tax=Pseudorhodoferax sp. TaxID=1993553 RepID=UPI002DD64BD9|nr:lipocalin family protein [Pseudorhodoferax sp.]
MKPRFLALLLGVTAAGAALAACSSMTQRSPTLPLPHANGVDLPRYMGRWYVISSIPTFLERGAVDAVEHYTLRPDGSVDIDFRYRRNPGDSEHALGSRGFVQSGDSAIWGVQFVWPIRADYRIAWLAPDYSRVIVAREKRDHVWIMARTPTLPQADYDAMVQQVGAMGYNTARLERVPHDAAMADR